MFVLLASKHYQPNIFDCMGYQLVWWMQPRFMQATLTKQNRLAQLAAHFSKLVCSYVCPFDNKNRRAHIFNSNNCKIWDISKCFVIIQLRCDVLLGNTFQILTHSLCTEIPCLAYSYCIFVKQSCQVALNFHLLIKGIRDQEYTLFLEAHKAWPLVSSFRHLLKHAAPPNRFNTWIHLIGCIVNVCTWMDKYIIATIMKD